VVAFIVYNLAAVLVLVVINVTKSVALLVAHRTNNRKVVGSRLTKVV